MKSSGATRRTPERTCVVCRRKGAQRDFVRIAAVEHGARIDESGKGPGRGAYLCRRAACWSPRVRDARLSAALKTKLSESDRSRLTEYGEAHAEEWSDVEAGGLPPPAEDAV